MSDHKIIKAMINSGDLKIKPKNKTTIIRKWGSYTKEKFKRGTKEN